MSAWTREAVKWARTLHIYLSLIGFLLFVFFGVTGVLLNHDSFGLDRVQRTAVPVKLSVPPGSSREKVIEQVRQTYQIRQPITHVGGTADVLEVTFSSPGRRVQVNLRHGEGELTLESRGWAGVINDLHKGADSGRLWRAVLDVASMLLAASSVTGVILLLSLPKRRAWGLVTLAAGTVAFFAAYVVSAAA